MNRYQTSTPRAALVIAAIALTALTLGASVIAPAKMDADSTGVRALAAPKSVAPTPTQVVINPARIEVVAAREPGFISVHVRNVPAKRKQES